MTPAANRALNPSPCPKCDAPLRPPAVRCDAPGCGWAWGFMPNGAARFRDAGHITTPRAATATATATAERGATP